MLFLEGVIFCSMERDNVVLGLLSYVGFQTLITSDV